MPHQFLSPFCVGLAIGEQLRGKLIQCAETITFSHTGIVLPAPLIPLGLRLPSPTPFSHTSETEAVSATPQCGGNIRMFWLMRHS